MGRKEDIVYRCKKCGRADIAGTMGAIVHSRSHGTAVTGATLKTLFTLVKDPPPEVVADIQKRRKVRENWESKKAGGGKKKRKKNLPEESPEDILKRLPKLGKIVDAKTDENGVTLTAEIFIPKDFFSSVIVQSIM